MMVAVCFALCERQ